MSETQELSARTIAISAMVVALLSLVIGFVVARNTGAIAFFAGTTNQMSVAADNNQGDAIKALSDRVDALEAAAKAAPAAPAAEEAPAEAAPE